MISPLERLAEDRKSARELEDAMVDRCILATIDRENRPSVRTLVLREVDSQLAIFCSATSEKNQHFRRSYEVALVIWLPSVQVQWRLDALIAPIPAAVVASFWANKPEATKRLDALYGERGQGSAVVDRDLLLAEYEQHEVPQSAPANAIGFYLEPYRAERLDLNSGEAIHRRQRFERVEGDWLASELVP